MGGEPIYAGFWVRAAAVVIDAVVTTVLVILVAFVVGAGLGAAGVEPATITSLGGLVGLLVVILYFALMESGERGATLGKRAFNLRVASARDLGRIGFGRAAGRYFARFLSLVLVYVGYLMQPFTRRKQALHDMISGTVVVLVAPASGLLVAVAVVLALLVPGVGILAAISIPAYSDYTVRARVSEALLSASAARTAVTEFWITHDRFPRSLEEAGVTGDGGSRYVQSITIDSATGVITVTLALAPLEGKTLLLVPEKQPAAGALTWTCRAGSAPQRHLPRSCRN